MSETTGTPLVRRMRMARRVADTLLPLEGDVTVTAASTNDVLTGPVAHPELRVDFTVTTLDLMIQLSLLVDCKSSALDDPEMIKAANALLWSHPECSACVLVANDEILTSRIVEWGDQAVDNLKSSVSSGIPKRGPLREAILRYLSTIDLPWPEPSTLTRNHDLAFDQVASRAAEEVVAEGHKARRSPIPERARARESLSTADAHWATQLALSVINGTHVDLEVELGLDAAKAGDH